MKNRLGLKVLFLGMSIYMAWLVFATASVSSLAEVEMTPWFRTTLIDFYLNTTVLAAWVIYKERTLAAKTLWILGFVMTGAVAVCLYVFVQLCILKPGESLDNVVLANKK